MMAKEMMVYGSSNTATFLPHEGVSAEGFEALFSPVGFYGSRGMINFDETPQRKRVADEDSDEFIHLPSKKRRLSDDQIEFLERSFEVENRLEPDRKVELAKELGLEPKQVAIWFQNRRARWKIKQLEKDYDALKCSYDSLQVNFECLCREKEDLQAEILILSGIGFRKNTVVFHERCIRSRKSLASKTCSVYPLSRLNPKKPTKFPKNCRKFWFLRKEEEEDQMAKI